MQFSDPGKGKINVIFIISHNLVNIYKPEININALKLPIWVENDCLIRHVCSIVINSRVIVVINNEAKSC